MNADGQFGRGNPKLRAIFIPEGHPRNITGPETVSAAGPGAMALSAMLLPGDADIPPGYVRLGRYIMPSSTQVDRDRSDPCGSASIRGIGEPADGIAEPARARVWPPTGVPAAGDDDLVQVAITMWGALQDAALLRRVSDPQGPASGPHNPVGSRVLTGLANDYSLPGNRMANGEIFDPDAMNAAMLNVRLGTTVTVALADGPQRSVNVVVTDRGPYVAGRIIDLTPAAFTALAGSRAAGLIRVLVSIP